MKVLWLINIPLPEASILMNEKPTPFGGWMVNSSILLSEQKDIELSVAFPKKGLSEVQLLQGNKIRFYAFPPVNYKDVSINHNIEFDKILEEVKPDIVHIFGTEYPHTLAMVNICKEKSINAVINIQGLVSIYSYHYMANVPDRVQRRFTFRDFIKQDNLVQQQKKFAYRGKFEIEAIEKVKHVIGRTDWDRACTTQINPDINYHFCNETLREEFYKYTWNINKCEEFSIFLSQGAKPIKGLHFMLEAMPLILKRFPNTKLYVAGDDFTKTDTLKEKMKMSSYSKYIKELIKKMELNEKVVFTGLLNEEQMCERFLKSNIFVSPSVIENESNSLSEAKLLGLPSVASYVGGVTDRIDNKSDGFFYPFRDPSMLAYYICEIFQNDKLALKLSKNAKDNALEIHNKEKNLHRLIEIYINIIEPRVKDAETPLEHTV